MRTKNMMLNVLSAALMANTATGAMPQPKKEGQDVTVTLSDWLDTYFEKFKLETEKMSDGTSFQEALDFVKLVVEAAQSLSDVLRGQDRAVLVTSAITWLLGNFLPPDAHWLRMLLQPDFLKGLVEMVFRKIFPPQ